MDWPNILCSVFVAIITGLVTGTYVDRKSEYNRILITICNELLQIDFDYIISSKTSTIKDIKTNYQKFGIVNKKRKK
jgi:hypothetical protein